MQASELGGDARLAIADGAMEFPGVFEKAAVPLRRFDAQLAWRIGAAQPQGRAIDLRIKEARFENDDVRGDLTLSWRTGDGTGFGRGGRFPGVLELHGKLADGRATSVARYLPLGLPHEARDYVRRAVLGGTVVNASVDVKGDLWDFPFHDPKVARDGVFRITGRAKDVVFAYVPGHGGGDDPPAPSWPAITQAEGELVFDRAGMSIRQAQGRIFGVDLRGVDATVRDFVQEPVLEIDGQARGPLADMLRYVNSSPVGEQFGGALAQASASGNAELRLALRLPLAQLDQTTVKGSVQLAGNDVRLRGDTPLLMQSRGRVDFTHKGVQVVGAAARALGGEVAFDGGTQPDGSLRFAGQGTATRRRPAPSRRARLAWPGWPPRCKGRPPIGCSSAFVKGQTEALLTSNLAGLALNLPAPLAKAAEASLPLRVQTSLQRRLAGRRRAAARPTARRDGHRRAGLVRARTRQGRPAGAAQRGGDQQPAAGRGARRPRGRRIQQPRVARRLAQRAGRGVAAGGPAAAADAGYLPRQINLRAREAIVAGRRFTGNVVELQRQPREGDEVWRVYAAVGPGRGHAGIPRAGQPPAAAGTPERPAVAAVDPGGRQGVDRRRRAARLGGACRRCRRWTW